jgi:hypothetical protein
MRLDWTHRDDAAPDQELQRERATTPGAVKQKEGEPPALTPSGQTDLDAAALQFLHNIGIGASVRNEHVQLFDPGDQ